MIGSVTGSPTHSMMSSGGSGAALDHHHPLGRALASTAAPSSSPSNATATSIERIRVRASRAYSGSRVSREVFAIRRNCRRTCSIGSSSARATATASTGESGDGDWPPGQVHDRINSSAVEPTSLTSTGDAVLNCASLSAANSGAASARSLDLMRLDVHVLRTRAGGLVQEAAQRSAHLVARPAPPTAHPRGTAHRSSGSRERTCAAAASSARDRITGMDRSRSAGSVQTKTPTIPRDDEQQQCQPEPQPRRRIRRRAEDELQ